MPTLLIEVAKSKKAKPSLFGQRMKQFRADAQVSQRRLAELTGISHVTVARLETGQVQNPDWDVALKIASALGKTLNDFTEGEPDAGDGG